MSHEGFSYRFSDAVVRRPGPNVIDGLRTVDRGPPDFELFQAEHVAYVDSLERAGLKVRVLPPLEAHPDSVFIEETALCLPEGTVILRQGAPSRTNEAEITAKVLSEFGHDIHRIPKSVSTWMVAREGIAIWPGQRPGGRS